MKIALLGKGKTGSKVLECAPASVEVFDSKNVPTFEKLQSCDVIISFLPGDAFAELIPLLVESKKPVVTGSTGFKWPEAFAETLKEKNLRWIHATNFSLGVLIIKQLIERLHQVDHLLPSRQLSIHEVHHTKKLDAPSGTALSMKEWLQEECTITSQREGDVVGFHELKLDTGSEVITLAHEARDRRLFAEGAVFAAKLLMDKNLEAGLHSFQKVVERHLSI
jgi:4-hydroxy-tetrahydrodipicolinate reductase